MKRVGRRWLLICGLVAAAGGGLVAWALYDPWPARLLIPTAIDPERTWFAGDGRRFVVLGSETIVWDLDAGHPVPPRLDANLHWQANAPDGKSCLAYRGPHDGRTAEVLWVEAATGAIKLRLPTSIPNYQGLSLTFAADGRSIRALRVDTQKGGILGVVTWDIATGRAVESAIDWLRFSPFQWVYSGEAGLVAFAAQAGGDIQLWDVATDEFAGVVPSPPSHPLDPKPTLRFTPDGRTLVVANADGMADFCDVATRRWVRSARLHAGELDPASWRFSPDGRMILAQVNPPPDPGWSSGSGTTSPTSSPSRRPLSSTWPPAGVWRTSGTGRSV